MLTLLHKQRCTHTLSRMSNLISAHKNANRETCHKIARTRFFSSHSLAFGLYDFTSFFYDKKLCVCMLYNRIYPETFNGLLYCCSSAHRKECFINANFRLNSSARKGMMFVSKVQHFTLININKMVVTLIGEQFFVRILFFYLFFFLFFSFLCALLCFALLYTLLCSVLLLCCIITKVFFFTLNHFIRLLIHITHNFDRTMFGVASK